jgi:excisionase family DNA binding protein
MDSEQPNPGQHTEILTIEEAAALLKVPKSWLYERTRTGAIPHLKLGKYLRFPLAELLQWATAQRRQAKEASLPSRDAKQTVPHLQARRGREVIASARTARISSHETRS